MTRSVSQPLSNLPTINEGIIKKGGVNKPPSHTRPAPPVGQGASSSSSRGGSDSSNQRGSDSSNQGRSKGSS